MAFKFPKARMRLVKVGLVAAAAGVELGAAGTLLLLNWNPKDEPVVDNVSVVFGRIVEQNELVCASNDYTFVERASDQVRLFDLIDIPFTDNAFWYRYSGTIKVAVDLNDAEYVQDGKTITVTLSEPYVSSNTPDMDVTGVLEERNNALNPIDVADVDALQRDCVTKSEEYVSADGELMEEAKTNAEDNITRMFTAALGEDYAVEFVWRGASAESSKA